MNFKENFYTTQFDATDFEVSDSTNIMTGISTSALEFLNSTVEYITDNLTNFTTENYTSSTTNLDGSTTISTSTRNPYHDKSDVAFSLSIAAIVVSGVLALGIGAFGFYKCYLNKSNDQNKDNYPMRTRI